MSKIKGELSYKDWCIIKHSLQDKVDMKEKDQKECLEVNYSVTEKEIKELEEEKKTLERVIEIIDKFKEGWD